MVAMGLAVEEQGERDNRECPDVDTYSHYRRCKFAIMRKDYGVTLTPRAPLTWAEVEAYDRVNRLGLAAWQLQAMMDIDGVFEHGRYS